MIGKSIIFISQRDTKDILVFPNTRSLARRFNSISRGVKVIFKRIHRSRFVLVDGYGIGGYRLVANLTQSLDRPVNSAIIRVSRLRRFEAALNLRTLVPPSRVNTRRPFGPDFPLD